MAEEIRFPRLGWSMEEGRFVGWLKSDGDAVREGEPLFEMEGEKAVQEIEALGSGILHIPMETPTPDSVVPVGRLLGYLLAPGEKPPQSQTASPDAGAKAAAPAAEEEPLVPGVASPAVRRLARELGIEVQQVSGTGRSGRITREDIERFAGEGPQSPREVSSEKSRCGTPRAKRLAAQHRIDWESLTGTGRGGRVREEDVRRKVNAGDSSRGGGTSKLYTHRRRAIAEIGRAHV